MTKKTVILLGAVCVALAGQSAHALTSSAPATALRAMSGIWLGQAPGCTCVLDQDGSGELIQIQDILIVIECAEGITPTAPVTCENADLNCDGVIDFCDASRVWCAFVGGTNCCELDMACGACCHSSNFGNPCLVMSEQFCNSAIFDSGIFHGAGTTCDPNPCDTPPQPECTSDADCVGDGNVCTSTTCNVNGICETSPEPWGTSCDDGILCNGHENCQNGVCQTFSPPSCSDALDCTTDTCNVALDKCEHEINECNNDGVCNSPCETIDNCPGDCSGCNCVVDQNNDFIVSLQDILTVVDCAEGRTPSPPFTCDKADLDCNGVINYCDASRVFCSWIGFANCCEMDLPCGACCNSGENFNRSCLVVSEFWCTSGVIIEEGVYQGDGTVCTPDPCNGTPECTADIDCDDGNVCNTNICNANGFCETTDKPNGTNCPDGVFCNGDELCQMGVCQSARSRTCDDLNPCTIDECIEAENACAQTPIECNHDGVCDAPCENADNCVNDCSSTTCTATRVLFDGSMAYCPETIKTVRITLNVPVGAVSGAVEDSPPTGWIQISNISDSGAYDAANHKVKWGPFFAPFPAELTYDIVPPIDAVGMMCFSGTTAFDGGSGEPICGDECFEDSCCPDSPADEPQSTCTGCSDNCSATAGDGRVELCEVIRYACAWKRGCNDDLTGVSGGAFIWMTSECYCWDAVGTSWVPQTCGQSTSACCAAGGQGQGTIAANFTGTATVTMDSIRLEGTRRRESPKARGFEISVSIDPPVGTSAVALDLEIPKGMVVNTVSDGGAWDRLHRKVKWGPYFSDEPLTVTVTVTVRGSLRRTRDRGFTGTVSYDGKNYPIAME